MEKAGFGQTLIILDNGAHQKKKKKANVELPANGPDYNVMGL